MHYTIGNRSSSWTSLDLMIGIMCRKIRLFHTSNVNYTSNIFTKRFTPAQSTFDVNDPSNECYKSVQNPLLPPGQSKQFHHLLCA